ncbi:MAG TPA: DUF2270 domain-containing protein [Blastocatellia bacterium]|nr:DUF2270 domain-containing protein [Blastocatellia bacterium]
MISEKDLTIRPDSQTKPAPPIFPTNSVEFVNALSHYYRGELSRMMSWRDRLDRTTNWAIGAVAAMLSVSLSSASAHHGVLLFAMLLVFLLLSIESRRYRFFHVYRSRVRLIERNYYARILSSPDVAVPSAWLSKIAEDLRQPRFSMSPTQAMARRLRRNYGWLFLIVLLAWLLKTTSSILQPEGRFIDSTNELLVNASIGQLPGWAVLLVVMLFYLWLLYVMLRHREREGELAYGEVHV